jgi:hypothetical protein
MPRELTSCDCVCASPMADPLVQRTIKGSLILKRCAARRSGYAKEPSELLAYCSSGVKDMLDARKAQ